MAAVAEQHHDVARVRVCRDRHDQPGAEVLRRCAAGEMLEMRAPRACWESATASPPPRPCPRAAACPADRDLVRVGAAVARRHAADARDPHRWGRAGSRSACPCRRSYGRASCRGRRRARSPLPGLAVRPVRRGCRGCRGRSARMRTAARAAAAVMTLDRWWAPALVIQLRSRLGTAAPTSSRLCASQTERRDGSCVSPSESPAPTAPGASGLAGRSGGRLGQVEARRRDIVGGIGVEQRGEVLDLAAADAQL